MITDSYYGFFITNGATYRTIIDWENDSIINPYDLNQITVIAIGSEFTFIVNDKILATIQDSELNTGRAGINVQTSGTGDALIEFDNFSIWVPVDSPEMGITPTTQFQQFAIT